jgi:hypothetical protein
MYGVRTINLILAEGTACHAPTAQSVSGFVGHPKSCVGVDFLSGSLTAGRRAGMVETSPPAPLQSGEG